MKSLTVTRIIIEIVSLVLALGHTVTKFIIWIGWVKHGHYSTAGLAIMAEVITEVTFIAFLQDALVGKSRWCIFFSFFSLPFIPYALWVSSLHPCPGLKKWFPVPYYWPDAGVTSMLKILKHGHRGFVVAGIEGLFQAFLQIIVIFSQPQANPTVVVVLGLVFAVGSFCINGIFISYSPHLRTFIFNSFCCLSDGFGLFCVASWLLYSPFSATIPSPSHSIYTVIWSYTFALLLFGSIFVGLIAVLLSYRFFKEDLLTRIFSTVGLLVMAGLVWLGPCFLHLSLLPLYLLRADLMSDSDAATQLRLIDFLSESRNQDDYHLRIRSLEIGESHNRSSGDGSGGPSEEVIEVINRDDKKKRLHYDELEKRWNLNWKAELQQWSTHVFKIIYYLWIPIFLVFSIYHFLYPILMFSTTISTTTIDISKQPARQIIQYVLSIIYIFCNAALLLLTPSVIQYHQLLARIPQGASYADTEQYYRARTRKIARNTTALVLYTANARSLGCAVNSTSNSLSHCISIAHSKSFHPSHCRMPPPAPTHSHLDNHIITLLPRIFEFADFNKTTEIEAGGGGGEKKHKPEHDDTISISQFFASKTLEKFIHEISTTKQSDQNKIKCDWLNHA